MKIHEYQGKELLRKYGVPVPRGIVARSSEEAYHAAKELGGDVVAALAELAEALPTQVVAQHRERSWQRLQHAVPDAVIGAEPVVAVM